MYLILKISSWSAYFIVLYTVFSMCAVSVGSTSDSYSVGPWIEAQLV